MLRGPFALVAVVAAVMEAGSAHAAFPLRLKVDGSLSSSVRDVGGGHVRLANLHVTIEKADTSVLYTEDLCGIDVVGQDALFSIVLGSTTPVSLPFDEQYFARVVACFDREGCDGITDPASCNPRNLAEALIELAPVAFAHQALDSESLGGIPAVDFLTVDTIFDGDVTGPWNDLQLKPLVVQNADIAMSAITSDRIADGEVMLPDLASDSVNSSKIVDGSVGLADLGPGSVDSSKIIDGSVGLADLGPNSVDSSKIVDGSVANADLGAGSVDSVKILDGSVALADLAAGSVDSSKIVDGSVGNADLGANSVTTGKIQDATILFQDIAQNGASAGQGMVWNGAAWAPTAIDDGDWTVSGSDVFRLPGRVGMGTSTFSGFAKVEIETADPIAQRMVGSNTIGTWMSLGNTTPGGEEWAVISTGQANGEGPGEFLFKKGLAGPVYMNIEPSGEVGIGTVNPGTTLDVAGTIRGTDITCADCLNAGDIGDGLGVSEVDESQIQRRVVGTCAPGSSIRSIDIAGNVTCEVDDVGSPGLQSLRYFDSVSTIGALSVLHFTWTAPPGRNLVAGGATFEAGAVLGVIEDNGPRSLTFWSTRVENAFVTAVDYRFSITDVLP